MEGAAGGLVAAILNWVVRNFFPVLLACAED
jgi:hypothetical protein